MTTKPEHELKEPTVEECLAELREMFPGKMVDVGLRVGPNAKYAVVSVFAASFQRDAPTLEECLVKVRKWHKEQ